MGVMLFYEGENKIKVRVFDEPLSSLQFLLINFSSLSLNFPSTFIEKINHISSNLITLFEKFTKHYNTIICEKRVNC